MKRRREINIKNPRLRTIRNNLREVLYLEWDGRSRDIIRAQSDLLDVKPFQEEEFDRLQAKLGENDIIIMPQIYQESIRYNRTPINFEKKERHLNQ